MALYKLYHRKMVNILHDYFNLDLTRLRSRQNLSSSAVERWNLSFCSGETATLKVTFTDAAMVPKPG